MLADNSQRTALSGPWPDAATVAEAASDLSWLCRDAGLFVALRRPDGPSAVELDHLAVSARALASFLSELGHAGGDVSWHLLPMAHAWQALAEEAPLLGQLVDRVPAVVDLVFTGDVGEAPSPEASLLKEAASLLAEHAGRR